MRTVIVTPPATEPVSVAEAKAFLRVDHADEDALIATLISATRRDIELRFGLSMIAQTVRQFAEYPAEQSVPLSLAPVSDLVAVRSIDARGVETLLSTEQVLLQRRGLRCAMRVRDEAGRSPVSLVIEYVAGFGLATSSVPADCKLALLQGVAARFEDREGQDDGMNSFLLPMSAYLERGL